MTAGGRYGLPPSLRPIIRAAGQYRAQRMAASRAAGDQRPRRFKRLAAGAGRAREESEAPSGRRSLRRRHPAASFRAVRRQSTTGICIGTRRAAASRRARARGRPRLRRRRNSSQTSSSGSSRYSDALSRTLKNSGPTHCSAKGARAPGSPVWPVARERQVWVENTARAAPRDLDRQVGDDRAAHRAGPGRRLRELHGSRRRAAVVQHPFQRRDDARETAPLAGHAR